MPDCIAKHGFHAAVEISEFEIAHIQALKEFVEMENIDCDFNLTRTFDVFYNASHGDRAKLVYKQLVEAGIPGLKDVLYTGPKNAEAVSGIKDATACFSYTAAHLWPYKLVMWLLAKVVAQGVNLQTNTPVTHISLDTDDKDYYTVTTPRGSIRAYKIVYASNAYTAGIVPQYTDVIVPCRAICSRIKAPEGSKPLPHLSNTFCIHQGPGFYDYLTPSLDGSIILGGARSAYVWNRKSWQGVSDDNTLIEPAAHYLNGYMQRTFRGWENSDAVTDSVWAGSMFNP